jgi:hypothetical protein
MSEAERGCGRRLSSSLSLADIVGSSHAKCERLLSALFLSPFPSSSCSDDDSKTICQCASAILHTPPAIPRLLRDSQITRTCFRFGVSRRSHDASRLFALALGRPPFPCPLNISITLDGRSRTSPTPGSGHSSVPYAYSPLITLLPWSSCADPEP